MLDAITALVGRVWDWVLTGWDWVRRLVRSLIEDIRSTFLPPMEATVPYAGPAPVTPHESPAKSSKQDARPAQSPVSAPSPALQPLAPTEGAQPAPAAAAERFSATEKSDETALARMLASDDSSREVKFVRGWMAVERQRGRKVSMFEFLTRGLGYGPRNRKAQGQPSVYASTTEEPEETDRAIARSLLSGSVAPSAVIRMHKPGQLIERGKALTDAQILRKQTDFNEGIYGRIQGTDWLLLSPDAPAIAQRKGQSAADALDGVPIVPVMDGAQARQSAA